jgi:putative copper resistance protein D
MTTANPTQKGRRRRWRETARGVVLGAVVVGVPLAAAPQYAGWLIPDGGRDETSPLSSTPDAVDRGRGLYVSHCARCHGPEGKGSEPASEFAADLTDDLRVDLNTEGVLFYKVWNGHSVQLRNQVFDMPAFAGTLSRDEVWTVVEYLKVLRTPRR